MSRTGRAIEIESKLVVARASGRGKRSDCLMGTGFPFEVIRVFWNLVGVMVAQLKNVLNATDLYTLK